MSLPSCLCYMSLYWSNMLFRGTSLFFLLTLILQVKWSSGQELDPVRDQLRIYSNKASGKPNVTTLISGAPVDIRDTTTLSKELFDNPLFLETITHINRQNIPERLVHGRGSGAFGYFEVTNSIANVCRAEFLDKVGKKTPVAVRFSLTTYGNEGSDTAARAPRGFAVKFKTQEGNFDLLALNTPTFIFKDPIKFLPFKRSQSRNPATNIRDANMVWDFITLNPETINTVLDFMSDSGIPKGYRHMSGFGIHTFQVHNKKGKRFFVRFYFTPDAGVANITTEEANKLNANDPDSFARDLYEAIACNGKVSWTLSVQILTEKDVESATIDVSDITLRLPVKKYPLVEVGKLVLNRNPTNNFAEVEQLAFCPGNLVKGIDGGIDKAFQARKFVYNDAQIYRLGVNFKNINVNTPVVPTYTYNRDGVAPTLNTGNDSPNYFPNSFNGTVFDNEPNRPVLYKAKEAPVNNTAQAAELFNDMSKSEQSRMISNIVGSLSLADPVIQERAVQLFTNIAPALGKGVSAQLKKTVKAKKCDGTFA